MLRLVQLQNGLTRRIAVVEEPHLRLLKNFESIYALAVETIESDVALSLWIKRSATDDLLNYDDVYADKSPWRLLSPIDHPQEEACCLVSGTGLTHLGSAKNRNAMHGKTDAELTDSMKMFRAGLEGGRPAPGVIGAAPEWFHKGNGTILRPPGEPLLVPPHALDGGEEAEIAGVYVIGRDGTPHRIGMTAANEFSDHKFEKTNYLNLAGSKIRTCSIGPELVIAPDFKAVSGTVAIERGRKTLWKKEISTGEAGMCHSLANIEHHHFKFESHRRPGDVHVHYYGACALSFGDGIELADGDVMAIQFDGFGRPLRNPLSVAPADKNPIIVKPLA